MHTKPMSEHEGDLADAVPSQRKCSKCGSPMVCQTWESSCGGYEDYKYTCTNKSCRHVHWVDGIDS
jgi:ssDNA-binding Zn-finger/Zn-ribbon topoisomerase 1